MSYSTILLTMEGGVARLTLNRPDKLNSFTVGMHEELRAALGQVRAAAGVRALLLTGAGRGFCAGQDLGEAAAAAAGAPVDFRAVVERDYAPLVLALRGLPMPVVCAVNGVAAGAGASLALACDVVIARKSASFMQSFVRLGLLPDTGGTYFLPRLVGPARAMGLALLGDKLTAEEAAAWGLIWKCVEDDAFEAAVEELVGRLVASPPLALALTKREIYASAERTLAEQLAAEGEAMGELGRSEDHAEGLRAFFEKRAPVFHGR